jgi:LysM repeat protein
MRLQYITVLLFLINFNTYGQKNKRISGAEYIKTYKDIAIKEMHRSGIPASITLAQGMLESENGNSTLATEGNNHFGIKCHEWNGKGIYRDDDAKNECFRKYRNAEESYNDHTDFLKNRDRYAFLFSYPSTDYKNWAQGLKKAGYATNPSYPQLLIKLIEENKLYTYDQKVIIDKPSFFHPRKHAKKVPEQDDNFVIKLPTHEIFYRNRIEYVVVKDGDTFNKLADELEMMRWELPKYNDLTTDSTLHAGDVLYLQPKRNKAPRGYDTHIVKSGETMRDISQLYGVKMARLYKYNCLPESSKPSTGDTLQLRKGKKCK